IFSAVRSRSRAFPAARFGLRFCRSALSRFPRNGFERCKELCRSRLGSAETDGVLNFRASPNVDLRSHLSLVGKPLVSGCDFDSVLQFLSGIGGYAPGLRGGFFSVSSLLFSSLLWFSIL